MEARLQRRVQRYGWDHAAACYDDCWRDALAPATDHLLKLAALAPGERVLDVACGTGVISLAAARAVGARGSVLGVDISQKMVDAAAGTAAALGYAHCRFERCGAEDLPETGPSFDAALCGLGLMYVPEPERALSLMAVRLAPGGRLVASVWGTRSRCGWAGVFPIIDARVESDVCPLFFRLGTGDALAAAFAAAQLRDIVVERFATVLAYESAQEACKAALQGGPVALPYSRFDEQVRAEVDAEYLESIAPFRHSVGYRIPGEFVVVRGTRGGS
jgi:ubiquinone/menaquinone biosynthesis C-methylase UbiE